MAVERNGSQCIHGVRHHLRREMFSWISSNEKSSLCLRVVNREMKKDGPVIGLAVKCRRKCMFCVRAVSSC